MEVMSKTPFTFIHAADLHLGAPFRGLGEKSLTDFARLHPGHASGHNAATMTEAAFTALRRLEALCIAQDAAFLILAGDVYDEEDGILRARLALRDMFLRLEKAGVRVFLAHGNHDPLEAGRPAVRWPDNVTVFGADISSHTVLRGGEPLALVHGISHASRREKSNLAKRFGREQGNLLASGLFQVGVLHCAVGGTSEGHAPYAPCTLTDLTQTGMDYWALGHVHTPQVLGQNPCVVYPGSMQGLHVNESGPHGCSLVRVAADGGMTQELYPLAPVQWEKLVLDLGQSAPETLDELEETLLARLEQAGEEAQARSAAAGQGLEALFCRLTLSGASPWDQTLRRPGALEDLADRLRQNLAGAGSGSVRVWLKDLTLRTAPAVDMADLCSRQGLTGEVARQAEQALHDPSALAVLRDNALQDLFGHNRLRRVLDMPDDAETAELVESARALCCGLLEGE